MIRGFTELEKSIRDKGADAAAERLNSSGLHISGLESRLQEIITARDAEEFSALEIYITGLSEEEDLTEKKKLVGEYYTKLETELMYSNGLTHKYKTSSVRDAIDKVVAAASVDELNPLGKVVGEKEEPRTEEEKEQLETKIDYKDPKYKELQESYLASMGGEVEPNSIPIEYITKNLAVELSVEEKRRYVAEGKLEEDTLPNKRPVGRFIPEGIETINTTRSNLDES